MATAHFLVVAVERGVRPGDGSAHGAVVADILSVLTEREPECDVAAAFARTCDRLAWPGRSNSDLVDEALYWTTELHAALRADLGMSAALAAQLGGDAGGEDVSVGTSPGREQVFALAVVREAEAAQRRGDVAEAREWALAQRAGQVPGAATGPVPGHVGGGWGPGAGRGRRGERGSHRDRAARPGAMFRGNAGRTGDYGVLGAGPGIPSDWAYHTGATLRSSPLVSGGSVYVGSVAGGLHAVEATTGTQRWVHPTGGAVDASPAVADGTVFITSADGVIHALDAEDGTLRWACDSGTLGSSSPAIGDGVVVVGGPAATLLALDARTGKVAWTRDVGDAEPPQDPTGGSPAPPIESSPVIANGVVYVNVGALWALELATGAVRWVAPVTTTPTTSPAVADGVVYTPELGGAVCAVDAASGALRWRTEATDVFFAFTTVAVLDDLVVACGQGSTAGGPRGRHLDGGVVLGLHTVDGRRRWRHRTDDAIVCSPAVAGGVVYTVEVGRAMHLLALAARSGELRQRRRLPATGGPNVFMSSPAVAGGTVYLGLPDGRLIARPAESTGRAGFRRRLAAWWGRDQPTPDLPAATRPQARTAGAPHMSARRRGELQLLGDHYAAAARSASARGDLDEAVAWASRAVDVVEALREAFPEEPQHAAALAGQLYERAGILDRGGEPERGADDARRSMTLYRHLASADPGTFTPPALDAQSRLALLLAAAGDRPNALALGADAVATHRALAARHPGHEPGLARTLARYSEAMVRCGNSTQALEAGREALRSYRRRAGALGLDETLAFGRTAYNVATMLLPPVAETAAEGLRAAQDAIAQLTIVAQAGMGDAVSGARMLEQAFRTGAEPG